MSVGIFTALSLGSCEILRHVSAWACSFARLVGSKDLANMCAYRTRFHSLSVGNSQSKLVIAPSLNHKSSTPIQAPFSMTCVVPDIFSNVIRVLYLTKVETTGCTGLDESLDHIQQMPSPCM